MGGVAVPRPVRNILNVNLGPMANQSKWQRLPTEGINPATQAIDTIPIPEVIALMIADNRVVLDAVEQEKDRIALVAETFAEAVRNGGRLIFVGAGTSGRLGVLEAAEMPPTFGTSPRLVHAIMAGGRNAVHRAKEGVEDDEK